MVKEDLKKYVQRSDIVIENNTARWDINVNGDVNGLYTGTFTFRCFLTPTQKIACGRDARDLAGAHPVAISDHEDSLIFTLTQLKYRVLSGPPFWQSSLTPAGYCDIPDEKVLDAILEAAVSSELKYMGQLQERKEQALERAKHVAETLLEGKKEEGAQEPKEEA